MCLPECASQNETVKNSGRACSHLTLLIADRAGPLERPAATASPVPQSPHLPPGPATVRLSSTPLPWGIPCATARSSSIPSGPRSLHLVIMNLCHGRERRISDSFGGAKGNSRIFGARRNPRLPRPCGPCPHPAMAPDEQTQVVQEGTLGFVVPRWSGRSSGDGILAGT
ncbi:hypothetical protein VTK26DRAFT_9340 [Humicola hyalothermophila]